MPRKNRAVSRKNNRMKRREKGEPRPLAPDPSHWRVKVEDLVLPDGQCRFQTPRKPKARFATKDKADKALIQAQQQRARMGSTHVEKRVYRCPEGGCGGWHLTSREAFDETIWKQRRAQREASLESKEPPA